MNSLPIDSYFINISLTQNGSCFTASQWWEKRISVSIERESCCSIVKLASGNENWKSQWSCERVVIIIFFMIESHRARENHPEFNRNFNPIHCDLNLITFITTLWLSRPISAHGDWGSWSLAALFFLLLWPHAIEIERDVKNFI